VLPGVRKETINGFLEQATPFYGNLLRNPSFQARMGKFGYSLTRIQGERQLVEAVRQAVNDQLMETGEAQAATRVRDQALDGLDAWVSDFKAICRVALAEDPQRLEQLGILVLNAPRRKTKEKASA